MRDTDLPNLFIIGAPKCGTTSMFRWLSGHPEICASQTKETYFFADRELDYLKIRPNHRQDKVSDYLSLFEPVGRFTRAKIEGSTHYLYSEPAVQFISNISPMPHIIVQLRNPAARIWSHFNYVKQQATDQIRISFSDYVDTMLSASKTSAVRFTNEPWPQHLLENQLSYSNYILHLGPWLARIPRNRVKILILEQLTRQKRSAVKDIARWVDVNPEFYNDYSFEIVNKTQSRGSSKIRNHLGRYARYFPKSFSKPVKYVIDKSLGSLKARTSDADRNAIAELEEFFTGPNQRLQCELGVDLSIWR